MLSVMSNVYHAGTGTVHDQIVDVTPAANEFVELYVQYPGLDPPNVLAIA
jgi:hypothetical protein